MKAVLMTAPGKPEVLKLQEVPDPTIEKDTEILVRLHAAGVNPIDTKLRKRGTFYPDQMPAILGCDGAGVVQAVGANVRRFRVGDAVYFCQGGIGAKLGNYAQFAVVDERFVARKPESLSFAEAAAAPLVLITAWEALYDRARLRDGMNRISTTNRILIHAGAGGVGHVAIQLAKLQGAEVCTTVGSEENADFVRKLGADLAILYKQTDFVQATLDWTQGEGVELAFDTVGGEIFSKTFAAVQVYGDIVTILEADPATDWKTARLRNQRISFELMLTPMLQGLVEAQKHQADILEQCARQIDERKLKIHVSKTFPLEEAAAAHEMLEAGSIRGKIVLLIDD
ncbi:zinc-dependent alcohol dehydrogenase family protein [Microcoleus sp. FACHB-831]|uniref:zinc-dependent alcohol dehydrogenase family protein n=1 Tax=Microcoleus sp. FACHB-831 TaxID=2692827 RepID=UPI0016830D7F|nr:zinc-binding dehydrogenase [Microcoleus sp. FACHB-831]MBD1923225.1 zinc-dependent alcohol dehydrogenase family protein [Microcoleus sp. FACHB-831]